MWTLNPTNTVSAKCHVGSCNGYFFIFWLEVKEWDSRTHIERAGNKSERDEVGVRNMMRWSEATNG